MGDRELKTWVGDQLQTLLGFSEKVAVEYMIALGTCGSGGGGERRGAEAPRGALEPPGAASCGGPPAPPAAPGGVGRASKK